MASYVPPVGEWVLYPGDNRGVPVCCCFLFLFFFTSNFVCFFVFWFCFPLVGLFSVRILQRRCSFFFVLLHLFFFFVDSLKNWRIEKFGTVFRHCSLFHFLFLHRIICSLIYLLSFWRSPSFFFFFWLLCLSQSSCKLVGRGIINMSRLCSALRFRDSSESLLPWSFTVSFFAIIER